MTTDTERTLQERLRNPPYISHPGICRPTFDDATAREDMREAADRLDTLEARVKVLEKSCEDLAALVGIDNEHLRAETIEWCAQALEQSDDARRGNMNINISRAVEILRALKETPDV